MADPSHRGHVLLFLIIHSWIYSVLSLLLTSWTSTYTLLFTLYFSCLKYTLVVRIPATSYLVSLFTLIYEVLFYLLLPSYLDVPRYLNNRQRYCSVWPERELDSLHSSNFVLGLKRLMSDPFWVFPIWSNPDRFSPANPTVSSQQYWMDC